MPHSYSEQSRRFLTYIAENECVQIDVNTNEVIIQGKSCNLSDLVSVLIANLIRLESFASNFYNYSNKLKKTYWEQTRFKTVEGNWRNIIRYIAF